MILQGGAIGSPSPCRDVAPVTLVAVACPSVAPDAAEATDPMPRPPKLPDGLPPALAARLSDDDARELDAHRIDQERRRLRQRAGLDVPPFLDGAEAEAPGAGALWVNLPERFTVEQAVAVGARLQLGPDGVADALQALRRAELVADAPGGMAKVSPGNVPF